LPKVDAALRRYADALARMAGISPARFVAALRGQPANVQLQFLRAIFRHIEVGREGVTFHQCIARMPSVTRPMKPFHIEE